MQFKHVLFKSQLYFWELKGKQQPNRLLQEKINFAIIKDTLSAL